MIDIDIKKGLFDNIYKDGSGFIDFGFHDVTVTVFDDGDVGIEQEGGDNVLHAPQFDEIIRVRQILMEAQS